MPLLVIFGEEDQLYDDPAAAAEAYGDVPGARITILPDVGHSPNVEKPAQTSRLVLDFAAGRVRGLVALAIVPGLRPFGRWSTPQKPSGIRCSPRWRTSRTWTSPSSSPHCEQLTGPSPTEAGSVISPASQ